MQTNYDYTHTHHQTTSGTSFPWQYQPVKKAIHHPDLDDYTAYGLQLYHCRNNQRLLIANIDDISTNQQFVEQLAMRFTLYQLSPIHFYDAVYDAVADASA